MDTVSRSNHTALPTHLGAPRKLRCSNLADDLVLRPVRVLSDRHLQAHVKGEWVDVGCGGGLGVRWVSLGSVGGVPWGRVQWSGGY